MNRVTPSVRLSARNDYVKLDASAEQALSPIRHLRYFTGKAHVACGALVFATTIVLTLRTYRVLPASEAAMEMAARPQES